MEEILHFFLHHQTLELEQTAKLSVLTSYLTKTNYHTKRTMTAQRHWKRDDKDHTHTKSCSSRSTRLRHSCWDPVGALAQD